MTYDVHAHIVPIELMKLLRHRGHDYGIEVIHDDSGEELLRLAGTKVIGPFPQELYDLDARLRAMERGGVDIQLVSHRTDFSAYALDPEAGARYARDFNRILAEEVSRYPDRLLALGTVPLQAPSAAADELAYIVGDLGMVGVEIATTVDGVHLVDAGLDPFWEVANQLRCLVLMHPYDPLGGYDLSRHFLSNIFGRPAESTIAMGHLLFGGVLERYPDLVICMVHGGGYMPYQLGRWEKGYKVVPHLTAENISKSPLEFVRHLYFDSLVHFPEALSFLMDLVGPTQMVVGTDYPYPMHERAPAAFIDSIPRLTNEAREMILHGNVSRILKGIRR
ncbi:MAG: amidohydrolase family protein [bacterium]|nr:amidohydrolase [Acidimicrobiia bacterium]MCY4650691.1 amidohydrolase family protein [bacterium]